MPGHGGNIGTGGGSGIPGGGNPLGWNLTRLEEWAASLGEPAYRARQAAGWLFGLGETRPEAMTSLPAALRGSLAGEHAPLLPRVVLRLLSADGTRKFLLELDDGERVEMVLIPEGRRTTLCFSTQVGCPIGCLFCRTGRGGLVRSLGAAEMTGQVLLARRELEEEGRKLTSLVVMGMGEPLLNFEETARALEIITAPWGMGIPQRRVTLSTAGIAPRLAPLRERFPALNLAVSLNAPGDELRRTLMPGTRPWPLADLLAALERLPGRSRHPVTAEYVLIGGVNDRPADAAALARLLRGSGLQVNLIPCNDTGIPGFEPPQPEAVRRFAERLERAGVAARVRTPRGADIGAACGQLRAACEEAESGGGPDGCDTMGAGPSGGSGWGAGA